MLSETKHQIAFVKWLRWEHPSLLFWHTPNGGSRSAREAAILKMMGVKKGVPDLFFPSLKLFIEMKKPVKGLQSKSQIEVKVELVACGYEAFEACSFLEAKELIQCRMHQTPSDAEPKV